jgi:hypothetical protein
MQIVRSQSDVIEKVFRDKQGRLIRARFAVYEAGGRIKARLLDWQLIEALVAPLMGLLGHTKRALTQVKTAVFSQLSTFNFSLSTIYFTGTKARAPTF